MLLVEDNPAEACLTEEAFKESGVSHEMSTVSDGEAAMNFLRKMGDYDGKARPDLILLDLNLPRMNGHEVLKEIKSDPELKSIPVIVVTNSNAASDIEAVYRSHGNCYLVKPPELSEFFDMVKHLVEFWWETTRLPAGD